MTQKDKISMCSLCLVSLVWGHLISFRNAGLINFVPCKTKPNDKQKAPMLLLTNKCENALQHHLCPFSFVEHCLSG